MSATRLGCCVLVTAVALATLLAPSASAGSSPDPGRMSVTPGISAARPADPGRAVTVRGTIAHVAVDGVHGPLPTVTTLIDGRRHYDLTGLTRPLTSGAVVRVTGQLSGTRLTVARVTVLRAARPAPLARGAHGVTKTLVVPVYWTARPPKAPTAAQLKDQVVAYSRAWFSRVSGGRYTIKGKVIPWLRISRPANCTDFFPVERNVYTHLKKKGINPAHYGRVIAYLPCSDGYVAGQASLPGHTVELYSYLSPQVVTHEQGHNLGLDHAASLTCTKNKVTTVLGGHCAYSEYGDDSDTMGAGVPGFYSAERRAALGWLPGVASVGRTTTKTLVPYESGGHGLHAIRIKASRTATYWLEYRTRTSYDRVLSLGDVGLQVRLSGPGRHTRQLDLLPLKQSGYGTSQRDGTALAVDNSWQSPEGIRLTVTKMSARGVTVAIDFHPGKRGAPGAPRGVQLTPGVNKVKVAWSPPKDSNGAPITAYRVTELASGKSRTVLGGEVPSLTFSSLKATSTYRFEVRAGNELGWSKPLTSESVQPLAGPPTAYLEAPDTAFGTVTLNAYGQRNQDSQAPIASIQVKVDGQLNGTKTATNTYAVNTTTLAAGVHTFSVVVTDTLGKVATATHQVTVTPLNLAVVSPQPNTTVKDQDPIVFSLQNAAQVDGVVADLADVANTPLGQSYAPTDGSDTITNVDWTYVPDGAHMLRLVATSRDYLSTLTVTVPVNVANTPPPT